MPRTITTWLTEATAALKKTGIASARLDAEIILAHTLRKSRTFLHAHTDEPLNARTVEIADARLSLRCDHTPIAYIIGHKEFYGRLFKVTPATLIPRPESEAIIELLKKQLTNENAELLPRTRRLVDVGTGSGALGITAKLEFPELDVTLADVSHHALRVAETNARDLRAKVEILKSDLLADFPFSPDIILANLPYVDKTWPRSPETEHEPALALFAESDGLGLIFKLIDETVTRLRPGGLLVLEADPRQHKAIAAKAKTAGLTLKSHDGFCLAFTKG